MSIRINNLTIRIFPIVLFLLTLFLSCNRPYSNEKIPELIPFQKDTLWGYCDKDKNIVIEPRFTIANFFHEKIASAAILNGKDWLYGYINTKGDYIIEPKYIWVQRFYNGYAIVMNQDTYQIINQKGELKLEAEYINFKIKDSVYTVYQNLKSKRGVDFYDINLNKLNKQSIVDYPLSWFSDGLMPVKYSGSKYYVYVNENFKEIISGNLLMHIVLMMDGLLYTMVAHFTQSIKVERF